MAGLPKKYAKMGFKRGWAAYNRRNRKKRRSSVKHFGGKNMARRKYRRKRSYSHKKGGFSMGNITKVVIGAIGAGVWELFVSPMIPVDGMMKNILELAIGLVIASMPGMPMAVKAMGAALATINAYQIVVTFLPSGGSSGTTNPGW